MMQGPIEASARAAAEVDEEYQTAMFGTPGQAKKQTTRVINLNRLESEEIV